MSWVTPGLAALVAACLIPPLILLYFLKLRRRESVVPSTLLWKQSVQDMQANAPFQRLRMNLLLFLQLLALAALLLAIAQPEWEALSAPGVRTVLLIDRSASMTAIEDETSRLESAKRQAIEFIEEIRAGGLFGSAGRSQEVMIIGFAEEAQIYSGFSNSKAELLNAVRAITPTHASTRIGQALELARAHSIRTNVEGPGAPIDTPADLLLFSDGRIEDLEEQVAKEPVQFRRIGDPAAAGNVGIVAFDARRSYQDQNEIVLYARLANWSDREVSTGVFLSAGDQLLKSSTVRVPPAYPLNPVDDEQDEETGDPEWRPGVGEVTFSLVQPRGVTLAVEIDTDDPLSADNAAFVVVPPSKQLRIALVEKKSFVLETVLAGLPNVERIERMSGAAYESLVSAGQTERYDLVVFDDYAPSTLGPGRYLTIGALPPIDGLGMTEVEAANVVLAADDRHPVNQYVSYDTLLVDRHPQMSVPDAGTVLVEGANGPMMAEINTGGAHAIIVPFPVLKTNWAWDVNFVPLMQNLVDYLGHSGEAITESSLRPGDAISARLPASATDIRLALPDPNEDPIPLAPGDPTRTVYGPVDQVGVYRLLWTVPGTDGEQARDFAVNLFNERESRVAPAEAIRFGMDEVATIDDDRALRKQALWPWLAAAALLVVLIEWWVYCRRSYI
ncbi:MAG: BatA and WFA domain-containing protein [Phycisphaerales bacterium]